MFKNLFKFGKKSKESLDPDLKYRLREKDTTVFLGETVYRIEALRDFGDVKKGDPGGFVSGEHNLSHLGDCWLYDQSLAIKNSRVKDNAKLYYGSFASGNAVIEDNAQLFDYAKALDDSTVGGSSKMRDTSMIGANGILRGEASMLNRTMVGKDSIVEGTACLKGSLLVHSGVHITKGTWFSNYRPIILPGTYDDPKEVMSMTSLPRALTVTKEWVVIGSAYHRLEHVLFYSCDLAKDFKYEDIGEYSTLYWSLIRTFAKIVYSLDDTDSLSAVATAMGFGAD